ncbi:hypothetical protein FRC03_004606 [Tulasnella sp. 419]|nr:hypothetical protein FRC03_004606 [Tulasnella sp. 419]
MLSFLLFNIPDHHRLLLLAIVVVDRPSSVPTSTLHQVFTIPLTKGPMFHMDLLGTLLQITARYAHWHQPHMKGVRFVAGNGCQMSSMQFRPQGQTNFYKLAKIVPPLFSIKASVETALFISKKRLVSHAFDDVDD